MTNIYGLIDISQDFLYIKGYKEGYAEGHFEWELCLTS